MNCVPSRLRLPNKGIGGMFWWASAAGNFCLGRGAGDGARTGGARPGPQCSSRFRSSFSFLPLRRRPRWPRPLSPAQTTRRSPPSSRRSLATPPNSASKSTTTKVRPSTRRPAIVAINVRSAASPPRLSRLSRQICPSYSAESIARRMRSARPQATTFGPHIPPSQIRPGPLPSQSDGHSVRTPVDVRSRSFRFGVFHVSSSYPPARRRANRRVRRAGNRHCATPTPSAATASSPPRWRSTIPASPMNSPFPPSPGCRRTRTARGNSTSAANGRRPSSPTSRFRSAQARPGFTTAASAGTPWRPRPNISSCASLSSSLWPRPVSASSGAGARQVRRSANRTCIRRCSMSAWASALCRKA